MIFVDTGAWFAAFEPSLTRERRNCRETDTRANGQINQIVAESALVLQATLFSLARQASMRTKY